MIRHGLERVLCSAVSPLSVSRKFWQNYVWSETMAQIEKDCETCCPIPREIENKVTIVGAASDVGRIVCLFLKQQPIVRTLAMYDDDPKKGLIGYATDIAHIDTTCSVEAYQGPRYLRQALYKAEVVLICGGHYPQCHECDLTERELFYRNMTWVRATVLACSHYCPAAVIAIQAPPVDANFALSKYTLEQCETYNKRRLLGINSVNSMRANQLFAAVINSDPTASTVPVICGTSRTTRVPVFSATSSFFCIPSGKTDDITHLVREADNIICKVKENNEQGHLSIGFATARFIVGVMRGIYDRPTFLDSALVEQDDPHKCYSMKYCSTPLMFGRDGITRYLIPKINAYESELLDNSRCDLEDLISLGRCHATGEEYSTHPCQSPPVPCPPCPPNAPFPLCPDEKQKRRLKIEEQRSL